MRVKEKYNQINSFYRIEKAIIEIKEATNIESFFVVHQENRKNFNLQ